MHKLDRNREKKLKQRFDKARRHPKMVNFDYIVKGPKGNDEGVLCKICKAVLVGMIADDRFTTTERQGTQTIIRERLVQAQTPNYDSVIFEMDDGSAHETPVCKKCKVDLLGTGALDVAEAILDADLSKLMEIDEPDAQGQRRMDWDTLSKRKITKVV